MPTQVRIVGSGYTYLTYDGNPIAFCEQISDSGEDLVNPTPDRIHPLSEDHPIEIASAYATNGGQLTLTIRELWNYEVWDRAILPWLPSGANSIRELVNHDNVTLTKIILAPDPLTGRKRPIRGKVYHNCRVTGIQSGENITIGQVSIPKTVTITYTHTTSVTNISD